MVDIKIDETRAARQAAASQEQVEFARKKILPHQASLFERSGPESFAGIGRPDLSALKNDTKTSAVAQSAQSAEQLSYTFSNGVTISIPTLSPEEQRGAEAIFSSGTQAQREQLEKSSRLLGAALWAEFEANPLGVNPSQISAGLQAAIDDTYENVFLTTGEADREAQSEAVVFVGMWGAEQNLQSFFKEAVSHDELGSEVRADIAELEAMLADWPEGKTEQFSYREVVTNPDGSLTVIEHKNVELTREKAQELLAQLKNQEESLSTIGTKDQFRLQYMVERYQQVSNTLSNILKNQDDTRKGIINNIKA